MKNISLLISLLTILLAASPLELVTAAWWRWNSDDVVIVASSDSVVSHVRCGESGSTYGANSTYEANLRQLAAVLPASAASTSRGRRHFADRAIGYWPNRVQASAGCGWSGGDGDCAACIAEAFKEVQRVCPFSREANFFDRHCYLRLVEFSIFRDAYGRNRMVQVQPLVMGMMFQAFGLACIFLLFIQAWRHDRKKGNMTRHTPLLPGDQ